MASCDESRPADTTLQSDATPTNPPREELNTKMESLSFKSDQHHTNFSKGKPFNKGNPPPPQSNFTQFKGGFPFGNHMGQHIAAGGTVNAIQIGYANDLHIGNVINIRDCNINTKKQKPSKPSAKKSQKEPKKDKVKIPPEILSSDAKVTREMMIKVKDSHLGYKWKSLGAALDLSPGLLDSVEYENRGYDLDEIVFQMLRRWEQKCGNNCTVGKLAQALEAIEAGDIALKLN